MWLPAHEDFPDDPRQKPCQEKPYVQHVLKKHRLRALGLSKGEGLGSMQCMPCAMMLSSGLFLRDITGYHFPIWCWTQILAGSWLLGSCHPPTNSHSANPSHMQHDHHPSRQQLSGRHFTPQHHLSAVGSQMRTDFCPIFNPWRLSLWCLYKHAH